MPQRFTLKDVMGMSPDDLKGKSKSELLKIIDRLETEMKAAFTESFNKINENFAVTFSELFGGGSAEITLSDPENVLESGIEIKAAPPGKIIKNLMQLSGGEQAFIGVALFFAILKVNPHDTPETDSDIVFSIPFENVYLFDGETERRI